MRCSYSPTITTSLGSWIQRVLAPDKSAGPKNFLVTTSKSIIVRARLTELLMPYLNTFNKVQRRKIPFAPGMSKPCTACNPCLPEYLAFWQVNQVNSLFSAKSSYAEQLSFPSCASFGTASKMKQLLKVLTLTSEV